MKIRDELYVQTLGWEVLRFLKREEGRLLDLQQKADSQALSILEEIRQVLDDPALDDSECFQRIERIVHIFCAHDISTTRHDWG